MAGDLALGAHCSLFDEKILDTVRFGVIGQLQLTEVQLFQIMDTIFLMLSCQTLNSLISLFFQLHSRVSLLRTQQTTQVQIIN